MNLSYKTKGKIVYYSDCSGPFMFYIWKLEVTFSEIDFLQSVSDCSNTSLNYTRSFLE